MQKAILSLLFISTSVFTTLASDLKAFLNYATFNVPGEQPYLETYLAVSTGSLTFHKSHNGSYQTTVNISLIVKLGEEIKYIDKYELISKDEVDSLNFNYNMLDQKRISLPAGSYSMEITISDKYSASKPLSVIEPIQLVYPVDIISISDIPFIESYTPSKDNTSMTKNGIEMIPMVDNYYPTRINSIKFYCEVYNTDKIFPNEPFLINYSIEDFSSNQKLTRYSKYSKQTAGKVNVLLAEFPIDKLSTGNYNILIEVIDRNGNVLASKKTFFQRSNKAFMEALNGLAEVNVDNSFVNAYTQDELAEYIRSTGPISSETEKNYSSTVLNNQDLQSMRKYFVYFWEKRNNSEPLKAWTEYYEQVKKVNKAYSTGLNKGYETERGRVYLQYGPPNTINDNKSDPSLYPYEIWHYYRLKNQSNRKFVFVNKDLVTNEYSLLHSDAIGELSNNRWQSELNSRSRNERSIDPDQRTPENSHFGSKLKDDFQ